MKSRAPHVPGSPRRQSAQRAERVYGLAAALAAFELRPDAVLNIAYTRERRQPLADMLREAARLRIAYRELDSETLDGLAESVHHEGVCLLVRPREQTSLEDIAASLDKTCLVLALDQVQNPHNVGAILRSAAYFGAAALVFVSEKSKPLTAAAKRVAEGGAERVIVRSVPDLPLALGIFRDHGLAIIGCDPRAKHALPQLRWPERAVLVLGHEQHGLTQTVRSMCQPLIRIAGAGTLDSLNVSVSAGIFLASYAGAATPNRGRS